MRRRRSKSYLTVRNVPPEVADELERERRRRGSSLNEAVLSTLRKGLGLTEARRSNGLVSLAGGWSDEEFQTFEKAVSDAGEQIDEEVWR